MKILAVIGSPRVGETYKLVRMIEEKMNKKGNYEFEYIHLNQKDYIINDCIGCHLCISHGESKCPLKDDTQKIKEKMLSADGVILATPVYSLQVSAVMKKLIDHYSYMWHRPELFRKKVMLVASGGGNFKDTLKYLSVNATNWGMEVLSTLGVPHFDALSRKFREKSEKEIELKINRFISGLNSMEIKNPSFGRLMFYRMWRMVLSTTGTGSDYDQAYWKERGWNDKKRYYYTDAKINYFKKYTADFLESIMAFFYKKVYNSENA